MQLLRKMIILSAVKNIGKGVVKLEAIGDNVKGTITIFEPKGISFRLGIRIGYSRLYEYEMNNTTYDFLLDDGMDISERIECLVINNDTLEPIMMGCSNGKMVDILTILDMFTKSNSHNLFNDNSKKLEVGKVIERDKKPTDNIIDVVINNPDKKPEYKNDIMINVVDDKEKMHKEMPKEMPKEKTNKTNMHEMKEKKMNMPEMNAEKIPDKKEENKDNSNITKEKIIENKEKKTESKLDDEDFFNGIRPQLDELFKCYPADKELMRAVPDSKWVRVDYENNEYYVVGILYNGKRATHICYGVPGDYTIRPKQKSEWLPLDYADPEGKGYWVIFQDALTGNTIE